MSAEPQNYIVTEQPAPGIRVIKLNRPERLNAFRAEMLPMLIDAFHAASADEGCRVVILTGEGRGFCSGRDVKMDAAGESERPARKRLALQDEIAELALHMQAMDPVIIAAVKGPAVGVGFALAVAADIRIAGESAQFLTGAVRIGLVSGDMGTSFKVPALIGAGRAMELFVTGRGVGAEEAERIGLVNRMVPDDALMDAAMEMALSIVDNPPFAVSQSKKMVWAGVEHSSLRAAVTLESRTQILAIQMNDFKEAVKARAEKRPPRYTGT